MTYRPRRRLPTILFLVTVLSTFWAGAAQWQPELYIGSPIGIRRMILFHWADGLIYMVTVLGILLAHEMGHFVMTRIYRIPASLPFFIPMPLTPIGTMGAVIAMDGRRADRRQIFDVGIAGPLAGLVVAIPILWIGVMRLDLAGPATGHLVFDLPYLSRIMLHVLRPEARGVDQVWLGQLNPFLMAGWVGLLITGLNMAPISQLDGGHVIYGLFGRRAHYVARTFLLGVIAFMVFFESYHWAPMVILVTLIGTDHPPTADDSVRLGPVRYALGLLSLSIPILCLPPMLISFR